MSVTLKDVGSGYKRTAINSNFEAIEAEINNNLLSKNGGVGLEADLDANSQKIINLDDGVLNQDAVTVRQLSGAIAAAGSGLIASQKEVQTGADVVGSVSTFTGITYTVGGNNLFVFRNGNFQTLGIDYTETSSSSITWLSTPNSTDGLTFITNLATTNSTTDTSAITHVENSTNYNLATYLQTGVSTGCVLMSKYGVSSSESSIQAQQALDAAVALGVPLVNDVPDADFSGLTVTSSLVFHGCRNVIKPTVDRDIITASGSSTELYVYDFKSNQTNVSSISSTTKAIGADGCSVVSIENSRCINGAQGWFVENTDTVRFHKNRQRAMSQFPLYVRGFDDCEITNNISHNNTGFDGIKVASYTDNSGGGPVVQARRLVITDNISYENSSDGIDCAVAGCEQLLIANNICTNNGLKGIDLKITDNVLGNLPFDNASVHGNTVVSNVVDAQGISCQGAEDLTRDLNDWNIYGNTIRLTGASSIGIRVLRANDFNIHDNDIQCLVYGVRLTDANDGHDIYNNTISGCTTGVRLDTVVTGTPDNNRVHDNKITPLTRAVDIDAGDGNAVYSNEWTVPNTQYAVRYEANGSSSTNTTVGRNKKGESLALPTGDRVIVGEYYEVSPPTVGYPIRWVAHTQTGSAGSGDITNDGQLGHRTVTADPNGNTATLFIGEEILDTVARVWYKSSTTGSNNWKALN